MNVAAVVAEFPGRMVVLSVCCAAPGNVCLLGWLLACCCFALVRSGPMLSLSIVIVDRQSKSHTLRLSYRCLPSLAAEPPAPHCLNFP